MFAVSTTDRFGGAHPRLSVSKRRSFSPRHSSCSKPNEAFAVLDHFRSIFQLAEDRGSCTITMADIQQAVRNPVINSKLRMVGFPVLDPARLFVELGIDSSCDLSMEEFINGCMHLNGYPRTEDQLLTVGELSDATFAIEAAKEALSCVTKAGLTAIKSMSRPPKDICDLFAVIGLLTKRERKQMSWVEARQMISSIKVFLDELTEFNAGDIPESVLRRCGPLLAQPAFSFDAINGKSETSAYLMTWVLNVIKYNKTHRKLAPFIHRFRDNDEVGRLVMFTPPNDLRQTKNGRASSAEPRIGSMGGGGLWVNGSMRESGPLMNGIKYEHGSLANGGMSESETLHKVLSEHWRKPSQNGSNARGSPPRIFKKAQTSDALALCGRDGLGERDRRINELELELATLKNGSHSPVQEEEAKILCRAINQAKLKLTEAKSSTERLTKLVNKFEESLESLKKEPINGRPLSARKTDLNSPKSNTVIGGKPLSSPRSQESRPSALMLTSQFSPRTNGSDTLDFGSARRSTPFFANLRKSLPVDLSQLQQSHQQRQPIRQTSEHQTPRKQTLSESTSQQHRVALQSVTTKVSGFQPPQRHNHVVSPPAYGQQQHTFGVQSTATHLVEQLPEQRHAVPAFLQQPPLFSAQFGALTTPRYMSPTPLRMESAPERFLQSDASKPTSDSNPTQHAGDTRQSAQHVVEQAVAAIVQPQNALIPKWELKQHTFNAARAVKSGRSSIRPLTPGGDVHGVLQRRNPNKASIVPEGALNGGQAYDDIGATSLNCKASSGSDRHTTHFDAQVSASIITDVADGSNKEPPVPTVSATTFLQRAGGSSVTDKSASRS